MTENSGSKKLARHNIKIPSKLPSSLAKELGSSFWKNIINSIENKEVEAILETIKRIDKQKGGLCLPHPFIDGIDTFPIKNIRQGMCNYIFFRDSNNQNQWILCQCTSFVDAIFSEKYSGRHKSSTNENVILNSINLVIKNENKEEPIRFKIKKAIFSGYILDQTRPYHHFYDQLKWLVNLQTKKPIVSNKSFFVPNHLQKRRHLPGKKATFAMFPLVIGSNQLGMQPDQYSDQMEKIVYDDSLKSLNIGIFNYLKYQAISLFKKTSVKRKTLILWFGISGQKRIWVEQEDFLPALIQQLKPWFDSFVFLIDGYTQYEFNEDQMIEDSKSSGISKDLEIVNSIKEKLLPFPNASIVNLVGQTYRKKIQQCQSVDFFIANAGAGQLIPHRFCKKPGILHSNEKHCVFSMGINNTTVKLVSKTLVNDVGNLFAKGKSKGVNPTGIGFISYSIDVQIVVDMLTKMLKLTM